MIATHGVFPNMISITVRDYIAIKAMVPMVIGIMGSCPATDDIEMNQSNAKHLAMMSYLIADALIAESEKEK